MSERKITVALEDTTNFDLMIIIGFLKRQRDEMVEVVAADRVIELLERIRKRANEES